MTLTLPIDSAERKNYPLLRGLFRYFPAALARVANVSKIGNDKHNPGEEMYHARGKSMDHGDCILRHTIDLEDLLAAYERTAEVATGLKLREDALLEAAQRAWRSLADLQELCERFGAPLAPGAKTPTGGGFRVGAFEGKRVPMFVQCPMVQQVGPKQTPCCLPDGHKGDHHYGQMGV